MATNKERIEILEVSVGGLQTSFSSMEKGVNNKLHHLEDTISKLSELLISNLATASSNSHLEPQITPTTPPSHTHRAEARNQYEDGRPWFSSKLAKIEFPHFSGDDPTEWFTRVEQFFEYQRTTESEKVPLASFHLEGEANQWWQWLKRAYKEEDKEVTWENFHDELWARFGPTDCEDFDETLSKVKQLGSLREYQKEFERLGNRVQGWTQRALVGTFMGGLKPDVADAIRMFKPKSLKDAISLARMWDEQLNRHHQLLQPIDRFTVESSLTKFKAASPTKRLTWDEMQKRRAQGLCFNCDENFSPRHHCRGPQILVLECSDEGLDTEEPNHSMI